MIMHSCQTKVTLRECIYHLPKKICTNSKEVQQTSHLFGLGILSNSSNVLSKGLTDRLKIFYWVNKVEFGDGYYGFKPFKTTICNAFLEAHL